MVINELKKKNNGSGTHFLDEPADAVVNLQFPSHRIHKNVFALTLGARGAIVFHYA